jgi:uridine phosphorylase
MLATSEFITRSDGSIYHLGLHPHEIAHDIITVGDPDRVDNVMAHLDSVEFDRQLREFRTVTGSRAGKRWTIISTGIGTDNIDIVFNELDALVNVDFETRTIRPQLTQLRFYRLGTSGAIQAAIPVDSFVASAYAVDLGPLCHYYRDVTDIEAVSGQVMQVLDRAGIRHQPSTIEGSQDLLDQLPSDFVRGITFTAPGFYAPQGRAIRLQPRSSDYLDGLAAIAHMGCQATNLEMETAGIYLLAGLLGHQTISLNAILANRRTGDFSGQPSKTVELLIERFFEVYG